MKKHILMPALGVALLAVACGNDPAKPPAQKQPVYQDLTQRTHVLNNIEVSYNRRDINRYDQLLDANFTFFLSPGDVGGGIPPQWDRDTEILYNARLFDVNYSGANRCKSISLNIDFEDGVTWTAENPTPTETWYRTTVFYAYRVEVEPDTQLESVSGARAEFAVRNAGTEDAPMWVLVEMRDSADSYLRASSRASEASTWGQVKALYRFGSP